MVAAGGKSGEVTRPTIWAATPCLGTAALKDKWSNICGNSLQDTST